MPQGARTPGGGAARPAASLAAAAFLQGLGRVLHGALGPAVVGAVMCGTALLEATAMSMALLLLGLVVLMLPAR